MAGLLDVVEMAGLTDTLSILTLNERMLESKGYGKQSILQYTART